MIALTHWWCSISGKQCMFISWITWEKQLQMTSREFYFYMGRINNCKNMKFTISKSAPKIIKWGCLSVSRKAIDFRGKQKALLHTFHWHDELRERFWGISLQKHSLVLNQAKGVIKTKYTQVSPFFIPLGE